jgi:hypothetical protein
MNHVRAVPGRNTKSAAEQWYRLSKELRKNDKREWIECRGRSVEYQGISP